MVRRLCKAEILQGAPASTWSFFVTRLRSLDIETAAATLTNRHGSGLRMPSGSSSTVALQIEYGHMGYGGETVGLAVAVAGVLAVMNCSTTLANNKQPLTGLNPSTPSPKLKPCIQQGTPKP